MRENEEHLDLADFWKKKVKTNNINVVKNTKIIDDFMLKYWEEKTAGIIIKKINGLVMPPVKKKSIASCKISKVKKSEDLKLPSWFSFILKSKYKLLKTLMNMTKMQLI